MATPENTISTSTISTPTRKHFALDGRSRALDPRIDAARGDLADIRLADRVFAPHYAAAVLRTVVRQAPLLARVDGEPQSEVLVGEPFEVLELARGHAWGISPVDGAVGFVPSDALGPLTPAVAIVSRLSPAAPPLGTRLMQPHPDATPIGAKAADPAAVAEAMAAAAVPLLPAGRSGAGVDPAGLIFLSFALAGVVVPRFLDLQAQRLGDAVTADAPILRGDLLFSDDGVAIACDGETAVRVGSHHVERVGIAMLGEITVRRRVS